MMGTTQRKGYIALRIPKVLAMSERVVRMDDLTWNGSEVALEFRLTYEGPLFASNFGRDTQPARKDHKRKIRKIFHHQLKRLWEITPFLARGDSGGPSVISFEGGPDRPATSVKALAARHALYGFNFVPLVTAELQFSCWIDVLMLRRPPRGSLIQHGDVDNRLKTLFDCLTLPNGHQDYSKTPPQDDEKPFYCLLEDDRLISKITVETDMLLEDLSTPPDDNDVRLLIAVRIKPLDPHLHNIQFS